MRQDGQWIRIYQPFLQSKCDLPTLFERTAAQLGILHKLIRPYTPRYNSKGERSHREDRKRFYIDHRFFSFADFGALSLVTKGAASPVPLVLSGGLLLVIVSIPFLYNMPDKPTLRRFFRLPRFSKSYPAKERIFDAVPYPANKQNQTARPAKTESGVLM